MMTDTPTYTAVLIDDGPGQKVDVQFDVTAVMMTMKEEFPDHRKPPRDFAQRIIAAAPHPVKASPLLHIGIIASHPDAFLYDEPLFSPPIRALLIQEIAHHQLEQFYQGPDQPDCSLAATFAAFENAAEIMSDQEIMDYCNQVEEVGLALHELATVESLLLHEMIEEDIEVGRARSHARAKRKQRPSKKNPKKRR